METRGLKLVKPEPRPPVLEALEEWYGDDKQNDPSTSDEWRSPDDLYARCESAFGRFDVDCAATAENSKCAHFFTKKQDATTYNLRPGTNAWCNPPYSRGNLIKFTRWFLDQARRGSQVVSLVPCYPAERWWQTYVIQLFHVKPSMTYEVVAGGMLVMWRQWEDVSIGVHYVPGRIHFVEESGKTGPARFSSAVVVYRPIKRIDGGREA